MRRILTIGLAVIVILGLAGWLVLQSQSFWRWGGWEVVNLAQDRLNGELRVERCRASRSPASPSPM